ncbi:MAG: hypothetical protein K9G39_04265 [Chlorobium sp.]|uniref:type III-B CRISPR module-associated Cmr3 family protein n=1 Tax=Chlorobium sp. TaxID=1095 RepID=UPI0025C599B6|nr:type III-B CRISPR module-associated Cmr3 family protein [Chlorobium sp.]MCF8382797.1 hypothetical protein [Chlorobium sp.]
MSALDTLFFRDGKPFSIGEESWAEGVFPPFPPVFYGALRTAYFAANNHEFAKAGQEKDDPTLKLEIKNIYLKSDVNSLFPMPLDCVKENGRDKNSYHLLESKKVNDFDCAVSNNSTQYVLSLPDGVSKGKTLEGINNMLLDRMQLVSYLQSEKIIRAYHLKDFISKEAKVGIGRDRFTSSSADTGQLYRTNMSRPATLYASLSMVVEFSGLDLSRTSLIKLGGEGKSVSCSKDSCISIAFPKVNEESEEFFKIYLATPAIFKDGWYPKLENVEILAAAVGRSVPVGGFNLKSKYEDGKWKQFPKPLRYAVPAGSVYYCKGKMLDAIGKYHGKTISEERGKEGFGIAYIGKLSMEA